ncbi:MAG: glycosyltransferase, partial [Bryobacteraceae bacterium]
VAYFSDAFYEANGVATIGKEFEHFANRQRVPFFGVHAATATRLATEGFVTTLELRRSPLSFPLDRELYFDPLFTRHKRIAAAQVTSFGADLVHITGPGDVGILGAWVAHGLRLPLVASWHTDLHKYAERRLDRMLHWMPPRLRSNISAAAERRSLDALLRFYRMARLLMAPNQDMVDVLRQRTAKPTVLMPHGVDAALFSPERRDRRDHLFILGYVGRLTPEKNLRALAGIERALLDCGLRDFRLVLVGEGSEQTWLKTNLRRAEFRGTLRGPALARAFADMDVFLFPSGTDTFGLVVLEAMASGVPVIVAPGGGPQNQVRSGHTGFVASTPTDFAQRILELRNDPFLHSRMRQAARQHACSATWDKVFLSVYESYDKALNRDIEKAESR